jgi:archaellum component FlaC
MFNKGKKRAGVKKEFDEIASEDLAGVAGGGVSRQQLQDINNRTGTLANKLGELSKKPQGR